MKTQTKMNLPVEPDSFDSRLDWLGNELFAVKDGYGKACIADAGTGKIVWEIDDCFAGVEGLAIGDENSVYIARESGAKRSISAYKGETGEEIWNCYLSTSSDQFCSPLTQNDKYIFHTNSTQIYVVEKSTGKLVNKFKIAYQDAGDGNRIVLPWKDKVLYASRIEEGKGKNKKASLVLSFYDPLNSNAHLEDILTIEGHYGLVHMELLNDNKLFFLAKDAVLRILDLDTKELYFEHDFIPNGDQTMNGYRQGYMSQIHHDGDKFHFVVMATDTERNEEGDFISHKNYSTLDLEKKTLTSIDNASAGSFDHYYYDGKLVYTGYNTFKPDNTANKEAIDLGSEGEILLMKVIDGRFYLLQDNEDDTSNIIVL